MKPFTIVCPHCNNAFESIDVKLFSLSAMQLADAKSQLRGIVQELSTKANQLQDYARNLERQLQKGIK